jgi:hypothetical protein
LSRTRDLLAVPKERAIVRAGVNYQFNSGGLSSKGVLGSLQCPSSSFTLWCRSRWVPSQSCRRSRAPDGPEQHGARRLAASLAEAHAHARPAPIRRYHRDYAYDLGDSIGSGMVILNRMICAYGNDIQEAARSVGQQLHILNASSEHEIDTAFATATRLPARAMLVGADAVFFSTWRDQLIALAQRPDRAARRADHRRR